MVQPVVYKTKKALPTGQGILIKSSYEPSALPAFLRDNNAGGDGDRGSHCEAHDRQMAGKVKWEAKKANIEVEDRTSNVQHPTSNIQH
jgi:hypothetical protein